MPDATNMVESAPPDPKLESMLAGLDRLRMAGLISESDYAARYAKLSARMPAGARSAPLTPSGHQTAPPSGQPAFARYTPSASPSAEPAQQSSPAWKPASTGQAWTPSTPEGWTAPPAPQAWTPPSEPQPCDSRVGPGTAPALQPAATPSKGRGRAVVAGVCVVAVLGVAGFGALHFRDRGGSSSGASSTARLGAAGTAEPATVQDFLPAAKEYVQSQRGLEFTKDVPVSFLDNNAFEAKFLEGNPTQSLDRKAVKDEERVFKATHLIAPSIDLASLVQQSGALGIEGFYDVKQKELFVRGTKPTPYVREVLVHELTHALQDQHFGLDRNLPPSRSGESALAFLALAEGDASRVQHDYRATESAADQALAQRSDEGTPAEQAAAKQIPRVFLEFGSFPYTSGEQFVKTLISNGGNSAVDQAFQEPPTTSAQILEPSRYLSGGGYGRLAIPSTPVEPFDGGVWGAIGYKVIFDNLVETGALTPQVAAAAARAWGADLWLAWDQGTKTCWRDDVAASDPGSAPALITALSAWVASGKGAITVRGTLTGSGPFEITACTS